MYKIFLFCKIVSPLWWILKEQPNSFASESRGMGHVARHKLLITERDVPSWPVHRLQRLCVSARFRACLSRWTRFGAFE